MSRSESEQINRNLVYGTEGTAKVDDLAVYIGDTWDEAADWVLRLMGEGLSLEQALDQVRKSARETHKQGARAKAQVLTTYRIPQAVLDVAMELAEGDISRLVIDPEDGTITVVNQSRKPGF